MRRGGPTWLKPPRRLGLGTAEHRLDAVFALPFGHGGDRLVIALGGFGSPERKTLSQAADRPRTLSGRGRIEIVVRGIGTGHRQAGLSEKGFTFGLRRLRRRGLRTDGVKQHVLMR